MTLDLAGVFGAGLLTLLSPCVLPLIPIYLGMLLGSSLQAAREPGAKTRLLVATLAFSLGFGLVFTLLGLGASFIGQFLQEHRQLLLLIGGGLILLFGLKFLGILKLSFLQAEHRLGALRTGHRLLDAALFGVVFALGWTPCVGPILGSVLTFAASRTADPWTGALYLAVYSSGLALPLLLVGFLSDRALPLLQRLNQHLPKLEKVTGVALVAVGMWLMLTSSNIPELDAEVPPGPAFATEGSPEGRLIQPHLGLASAKPRLVEFFGKNCPSCQAMEPRLAALAADCQQQRIEILKVDTGDRRNAQLVRRYKVRLLPTIALLAPDGREVQRMVGERSLEELRQAAATLIEATCGGELPTPLEELGREPEAACGSGAVAPPAPPTTPARPAVDPLQPAAEACGG